jgi:hypothetical protein
VRVLSRLFRRLFLQMLEAAHAGGQLKFFGKHAGLVDRNRFAGFLRPMPIAICEIYVNLKTDDSDNRYKAQNAGYCPSPSIRVASQLVGGSYSHYTSIFCLTNKTITCRCFPSEFSGFAQRAGNDTDALNFSINL